MSADKAQLLQTLANIEALALYGTFGNPLTALTARMLTLEVRNSETSADAIERGWAFVASLHTAKA